jgi:hypothetical protein
MKMLKSQEVAAETPAAEPVAEVAETPAADAPADKQN